MGYEIKICLDSEAYPKCTGCPHHRRDPERSGDYSCYLDEDLQGKERYIYLKRLLAHYQNN